MTTSALWDEILKLPVEERLKLVQDIWDSIAATPSDVPVPDWHKRELDRRLDSPDPGPNLRWDEVRSRLRAPPRGVTFSVEFRPEAFADVAEAFCITKGSAAA